MAFKRKAYIGVYEDTHEEFVCDTAADLNDLPSGAPQGSAAFVIEDSTTWMINSRGEWIETDMEPSGGGDTTLTSIDITENGTYRAPSGTAYNRVTVAVEDGGDTPDPDPEDGNTHIRIKIDEDTPQNRMGFTLAWTQSKAKGVNIYWGDEEPVVEALSGPVVSFSDETGSALLRSHTAGIEPTQDLHGYNAPWPAGGGDNLLDPAVVPDENLYIRIDNGELRIPDEEDAVWRHSDYIAVSPGEELYFGEVNAATVLAGTAFYTSDKTYIPGNYTATALANSGNVITVPEGASFMRHSWRIDTGYNENWEESVYIIPNSKPHRFSPYANVCPVTGWTKVNIHVSPTSDPTDGRTYSVALPARAGTVYGGTLNLTNGTLTVDRACISLDGTEDWNMIGSLLGKPYAYFYLVLGEHGSVVNNSGICSHFAPAEISSSVTSVKTGQKIVNSSAYPQSARLLIRPENAAEAGLDSFKTWLASQASAGTPVQITYKLTSPAVYQLTPTEITTLLGENNIWADTGDTSLEVERIIGEYVDASGAVSLTHQYANSGEYEITLIPVGGSLALTGTGGTSGYALYGSKANSQSYNRSRITRIYVGENTAVGQYMAHYCYGLSRVGLPQTLTSIGAHAFEECFSLPSIEIPIGVTSIGEYAFSYCHSLESADIPDSVVSIGAYAFRNCYGLREIDFPSGLTSISDYTYQGCYNLTSIDIPSTVTSIGNGAFHSCYGLTSVRIPAAVRSIGDSAFLNCYGVSEYHIEATTPPTLASTNAFTGMASDCVIYVPRSTNQTVLNAYKAATNWVTYASRMQEEAE